MRNPLEAMLIVVPVHNEESYLRSCLEHLQAAMDHFTLRCPDTALHAVVVLDRGRDRSAEIFEQVTGADRRFHAVEGAFGSVGASRARGVAAALGLVDTPKGTWLACTDADSRVLRDWLAGFAHAAARGADAVAGTVEPDRHELGEELFGEWRATYRSEAGHAHIHGANLGVSAAAYRLAGDFEPIQAHEDVRLVERLRRLGLNVWATERIPVVTSGRLRGRLREGFADYLAALGRPGSLSMTSTRA